MKIAVKFWSQNPDKPNEMPDNWPWLCREINDNELIESDETSLTIEEFNSLKENNQSLYDLYIVSLPTLVSVNKALENMKIGQLIIAEFGCESEINEMSSEEMTQLAGALAPIQLLLMSGALKTAKDIILSLTPGQPLSQNLIDKYSQKIQSYLES